MTDILDTKFEGKEVTLSDNRVRVGEDINITARDPVLKKVYIGMGWDFNAYDGAPIDVDVSVFLLGKDGKTRVDEDFVFYNNRETLGGAVKHTGDSRTGAGEGDDEGVIIDLHGIPFDVVKVLFTLSIYYGEEKMQRMGQVDKTYLRVANFETTHELLRYELKEELPGRNETAIVMASLNREGPKWHFTPIGEFVEGGLAAVATRYGCIIVNQ